MKDKRLWTVGLIILIIAIILGIVTQCDIPKLFDDDPAADRPRDTSVPSTTTATTAAPQDHTDAFKKFILVDRVRNPDWYDEVLAVRYSAAGDLWAETSLPAGWRDTSRPSRPVESICGQLFAYAQRGAQLKWNTIAVFAADGSTLIKRTDPAGSCRQP